MAWHRVIAHVAPHINRHQHTRGKRGVLYIAILRNPLQPSSIIQSCSCLFAQGLHLQSAHICENAHSQHQYCISAVSMLLNLDAARSCLRECEGAHSAALMLDSNRWHRQDDHVHYLPAIRLMERPHIRVGTTILGWDYLSGIVCQWNCNPRVADESILVEHCILYIFLCRCITACPKTPQPHSLPTAPTRGILRHAHSPASRSTAASNGTTKYSFWQSAAFSQCTDCGTNAVVRHLAQSPFSEIPQCHGAG